MTGPRDDDDGDDQQAQRERLGDALVELVQRLSVAAQHVGQAFAARQGLHQTDLEALLHVLHAETRADPATAGALATALGISSGAATGVIDRLERAGHLQRRRGHTDRRKVTLHYGDAGRAVAEEFFGPLARLSHDVTDTFRIDELQTIARFLERMTTAMTDHLRTPPPPR